MTEKRFDVIVVGAGPAGVSAAKSAAGVGAKTLLLEMNWRIMAMKPCGMAVSRETLKTAEVEPSPSLIHNEAYAIVYAPNMKSIKLHGTGYLINKTMLLQEIACQAAERGAEIHVGERVLSVRRVDKLMKVETNRGVYETSVVIGADGYNSTVARCLGIREKSEPIPTIQCIMAGCRIKDPHAVRFYLGNEIAPKGYAWIFPWNEKVAEVGIGVRGAPIKPYLDKFIKMFEDELGRAQVIDYRGAPVPVGGVIKEFIQDNVILIGDAAGMVIPLTGGGIHSSISSGLAAGEVSGKAALEGDVSKNRLMEFVEKYSPWLTRIKRSLKVLRALENLSDEDLNLLAEVLEERDIIDLANGLEILRVAKKLLRHPRLAVKLAKPLLSG